MGSSLCGVRCYRLPGVVELAQVVPDLVLHRIQFIKKSRAWETGTVEMLSGGEMVARALED